MDKHDIYELKLYADELFKASFDVDKAVNVIDDEKDEEILLKMADKLFVKAKKIQEIIKKNCLHPTTLEDTHTDSVSCDICGKELVDRYGNDKI